MAAEQRIYKVINADKSYLVQATSQAQALRHVASRQYTVEVAKAIDVAQMMSNGAQVEIATVVPEQGQLDVGN